MNTIIRITSGATSKYGISVSLKMCPARVLIEMRSVLIVTLEGIATISASSGPGGCKTVRPEISGRTVSNVSY